jgi:OOP family OmpA-OmpF porin
MMKNSPSRFLFCGCLAAAVTCALEVRAQSTRFYVKADVGGNITQDIEVHEFLGANVGGTKLKLDPGFRAGIGGGYQVTDWFAAEVELGYMGNEIDSVSGPSGGHAHDAWFENVPFLVNGKLQLPMGRCPVTPYVGAGAGFSESVFDVRHLTIDGVSIRGNDADTVFAWQAFAGLRYALNDRMGLGLEYRYFQAESPSWRADFTFNTAGDTFKLGRTQTHAISVAFDYRF